MTNASDSPDAEPLYVHTKTVLPEWVDHNGHMNDSFYVYVSGYGFDGMMATLGLTDEYRAQTQCTTYSLENHIVYLGESKLGDPIAVHVQVLDADAKRVHAFVTLSNEKTEDVLAVCETMQAHIDQNDGPKVAPMPEDIQNKLFAIRDAHASLPKPEQAGRTIGIRRKPQ